MYIIWIYIIKKFVKIFWIFYRNGLIIISKNLIEKYKSNKMIMKYKSWIYIYYKIYEFFFLMSGDKWIIFYILKNINIFGIL